MAFEEVALGGRLAVVQQRIGVKETEKGDFTATTPFFVILSAVKDLSKTRRRK